MERGRRKREGRRKEDGKGERMVQREKRKKGGEGRDEQERKEGGGRRVGMTSGDLGNEWSLELGWVKIEDLPVKPGCTEFCLHSREPL